MINFFRSHAIAADTKLLAALSFYATGLMSSHDFLGISKKSMSWAVSSVSEALASLRPEIVYMPSSEDELQANYRVFFQIGRFPTVVGSIACTHVKILGQGGNDGEVFRNQKDFFSINVQSIANADLTFQDIVARWPGSTPNSHIFKMSRIYHRFRSDEFGNSVLVGDGGCRLKPYLMTPIENPETDDEETYNRVHSVVHNTVVCQHKVWKKRFPCLALGLKCKLETTLDVIVACAVLHNFAIRLKFDLPDEDPETEAAINATTLNETTSSYGLMANDESILKRQSFVEQISSLN